MSKYTEDGRMDSSDDLDVTEEELALINGDPIDEVIEEVEEVEETAEVEETEEQTDEDSETVESEEDAEPVEEEAEEETHNEPRIPKARLDREIQKRRELEAQLQALQAKQQAAVPQNQQPAVPEFDFDSKESEYMEAVLDGETQKALAIRNEIRAAERQAYERQATQVSQQSVQMQQMQQRVAQTVAEINQAAPLLDPDSAEFDDVALQYALQVRDGFIATGRDPVEAIQEAAQIAMLKFGKPAAAPQPTPVKRAKQPVSKSKVDAANKQPPSIGDKSSQNDVRPKIDVMSMTEAEFDALSEKEIQELLASS